MIVKSGDKVMRSDSMVGEVTAAYFCTADVRWEDGTFDSWLLLSFMQETRERYVRFEALVGRLVADALRNTLAAKGDES